MCVYIRRGLVKEDKRDPYRWAPMIQVCIAATSERVLPKVKNSHIA